MKKLLVVLLILISFSSFSQAPNPVFKRMDTVQKIADTNYFIAKSRLIRLEKESVVDPAEKLLFLTKSLENNDMKYFKKEMTELIIRHGYNYTPNPYSLKKTDAIFCGLLREHNLEEWISTKCQKLYPKWIKNNPKAFEVQQAIAKIAIKDQTRKYFYQIIKQDSSLTSKEVLMEMDANNLNDLISITNQIGILPNHFDHGLNTFYLWQTCLFHNLYEDRIEQVWLRMLPYIEQAYFSGKIGDGLFRLYDFQLNLLFGYQYYGFLENVPFKDEGNLQERKRKCGFI